MPRTPSVARPIGRSAASSAVNRIDIALRVTSSRSWSWSISTAPTSSSSVAQVDRDDAALARGVEVGQPGLLHLPARGGQHQVRRDRVVLDLHDLGDLLVRLERQDVRHVLAAGGAVGLGQLVGLGPVDPALVREEQDPVVGGAHEEVVDDVVLLERRAHHALAAAALRAVEVALRPLGVAGAGDGDDDLLLRDEVLHRHVAVVGDELGAPVVAVLLDDLGQLVADDLPLPLGGGEDRLRSAIRASISASSSRIRWRSRAASRRSCRSRIAIGLDLVDVEQLHQAAAGGVGRLAAADEGDDGVELVEGLGVAAQDVRALLGLAQPVPGAPLDDLDLVVDVVRGPARRGAASAGRRRRWRACCSRTSSAAGCACRGCSARPWRRRRGAA